VAGARKKINSKGRGKIKCGTLECWLDSFKKEEEEM